MTSPGRVNSKITAFDPSWVAPWNGVTGRFDGTDYFYSSPTASGVYGSSELIVEIWLRPNTLTPSATQGLAGLWAPTPGGAREWALEYNTSGEIVFKSSDDGSAVAVTDTCPTKPTSTTEWFYIAVNTSAWYLGSVVADVISLSVIAGSSFTAVDTNPVDFNPNAQMWVGSHQNAATGFNGDIMRVWADNRILGRKNEFVPREHHLHSQSNWTNIYPEEPDQWFRSGPGATLVTNPYNDFGTEPIPTSSSTFI